LWYHKRVTLKKKGRTMRRKHRPLEDQATRDKRVITPDLLTNALTVLQDSRQFDSAKLLARRDLANRLMTGKQEQEMVERGLSLIDLLSGGLSSMDEPWAYNILNSWNERLSAIGSKHEIFGYVPTLSNVA